MHSLTHTRLLWDPSLLVSDAVWQVSPACQQEPLFRQEYVAVAGRGRPDHHAPDSRPGQPHLRGAAHLSAARPGEQVGSPLGKPPRAVTRCGTWLHSPHLSGPSPALLGPCRQRLGAGGGMGAHRPKLAPRPGTGGQTGRPRAAGEGVRGGPHPSTAGRARQEGPGRAPHHAPGRRLSPVTSAHALHSIHRLPPPVTSLRPQGPHLQRLSGAI